MFSSLSAGGRCAKVLCGIAGVLLCGAPILVTIGIVLMMTVNTERDDMVDDYNTAVAAYQPGPVNSWVPATINGAPATIGKSSVAVTSGADGTDVNAATSTYVQASISSISSGSTITYRLANVEDFSRSGLPSAKVAVSTAFCSSAVAGRRGTCLPTAMGQYCRSNFGPYAIWQNSDDECKSNGDCGVCIYTLWLTDYCAVIETSSNPAAPYRESAKYQSCYYPFGEADQRYDSLTRPSRITLTVRKSDDPFIAMQRITEGTNDFGSTKSDIHSKGIVFIGAGFGLLFALCLLCCGMYCLISKGKDRIQQQEREARDRQLEEGRSAAATLRSREPVAGQPMAFAGTNDNDFTMSAEPYWTSLGNGESVFVIGQPIVCPYGESSYIEELTQPVPLPFYSNTHPPTTEIQLEVRETSVIEIQPSAPRVEEDKHAFI